MKKPISKLRIPKSADEVKGFKSQATWEKEQLEKYKSRSLKGKNIPDYGEYRAFFTRATLLNDYAGLNQKEKWLRQVMELFRNNKTNIAYPPFSQLKKLTSMSKNTLISTIRSLEAKKVFKVERRAGENNIYRFTLKEII